ncbi:MAG: NADH-quinone oxidoreductase subunit C, partial [Proteobacteria bacterium]
MAQASSASLDALRSDLSQSPVSRERFANYKFYSTAVRDDVIEIPKEDIVQVLRFFKETNRFDILMDLCGSHYPERPRTFEVVYHLFSTRTFQRLRLKCQVGENESIDSAITVWKSANWFEREAWDMFGIRFNGHPNLTRLLTHHEFQGHPLRKDYDADQQQHCSSALPLHFDPSHSHLLPEAKGQNLV